MLNVSGNHPFDFKTWFSTHQFLAAAASPSRTPSTHATQISHPPTGEPLTLAHPTTHSIVTSLVTPVAPESSVEHIEQRALAHWIRQSDSPASPVSPRTLVCALESLFPTLFRLALADPSLRAIVQTHRE